MVNRLELMKMFPVPPKDEDIECPYCGKHPDEIEEYVEQSRMMGVTPLEFVKIDEGTYCSYTGCFTCTPCYVKIGTPLLNDLLGAYPYFRAEVKALDGQDDNAITAYKLG